MIRLYGQRSGSFEQVTAGLESAFKELGALDGLLIPENQGIDFEPVGGAVSPIAVVVGDPLRTIVTHRLGHHDEVWLMLAPNSEGVPPQTTAELSKQIWSYSKQKKVDTIDGLLAPSKWAREVLSKQFPRHRVEYCPHGVSPWFEPVPSDAEKRLNELTNFGVFRCLHVASTTLSRKGTRPLLQAWSEFEYSANNHLTIRVNPRFVGDVQQLISEFGCRRVSLDIGQHTQSQHWASEIRSHHCVVQPSRAEGFGLVPLEALACGVPVIMTACTGHSDYYAQNQHSISKVEHGELADSDDYWGAQAPVVTAEAVLDALKRALLQWPKLSAGALEGSRRVRGNTWTRGARDVVDRWSEKYKSSTERTP